MYYLQSFTMCSLASPQLPSPSSSIYLSLFPWHTALNSKLSQTFGMSRDACVGSFSLCTTIVPRSINFIPTLILVHSPDICTTCIHITILHSGKYPPTNFVPILSSSGVPDQPLDLSFALGMTSSMSPRNGPDDCNLHDLGVIRVGGKYRLQEQIGAGTFGA